MNKPSSMETLGRRGLKRILCLWLVASIWIAVSRVPSEGGPRMPGAPRAELLLLDGRLGEPRPEDKGTTDLLLSHGRKEYRFQLANLKVLTGGRLPSSILADIRPFRSNLLLRGAVAMVQRLGEAGPDDRLEIKGYYRAGSRSLLVSEINILSPPTRMPDPTPGPT